MFGVSMHLSAGQIRAEFCARVLHTHHLRLSCVAMHFAFNYYGQFRLTSAIIMPCSARFYSKEANER